MAAYNDAFTTLYQCTKCGNTTRGGNHCTQCGGKLEGMPRCVCHGNEFYPEHKHCCLCGRTREEGIRLYDEKVAARVKREEEIAAMPWWKRFYTSFMDSQKW